MSQARTADGFGADTAERYHAFDALRAVMMLLGLVLHTTTSYAVAPLGDAWPFKDPKTSLVFDVLLVAIHSFRMPVFFVMAGFFAALFVERRGLRRWSKNRLVRVLVPFVLGYLGIVPLTAAAFHFAQVASAGAGTSPTAANTASSTAQLYGDNTGHLWFLYYLLWFYALSFVVLRGVAPRTRARCQRGFQRLMTSRFRAAPFVAILAVACSFMPFGGLETSLRFAPNLAVVAAYLPFYVFGWLLYGWREHLGTLRGGLPWRVGATTLAFVGHLACAVHAMAEQSTRVTPWVVAAATTGALLTWSMTFTWLSAFLRVRDQLSPWSRYLTDSSYWTYLVHLPVIVALAGLAVPWAWPVAAKAAFVFLGTSAVCFATYALFVRGTWIGVLLSGRRYPAGAGGSAR